MLLLCQHSVSIVSVSCQYRVSTVSIPCQYRVSLCQYRVSPCQRLLRARRASGMCRRVWFVYRAKPERRRHPRPSPTRRLIHRVDAAAGACRRSPVAAGVPVSLPAEPVPSRRCRRRRRCRPARRSASASVAGPTGAAGGSDPTRPVLIRPGAWQPTQDRADW